MSPMESFFSVKKKVFIEVSHVNNQPWTVAIYLIKKGERAIFNLSRTSYQLISCDVLWVLVNKNNELFLCLQRPNIFIIWHCPNSALLHLDTKMCSQTLANTPSSYVDTVTLSLFFLEIITFPPLPIPSWPNTL